MGFFCYKAPTLISLFRFPSPNLNTLPQRKERENPQTSTLFPSTIYCKIAEHDIRQEVYFR